MSDTNIVNAAAVVRGIMLNHGTDTEFNLTRSQILNIAIPQTKVSRVWTDVSALMSTDTLPKAPQHPTIGDLAKIMAEHLHPKTLKNLGDAAAKPFQQRRQASEIRAANIRDMTPTKQTKERYVLSEANAL